MTERQFKTILYAGALAVVVGALWGCSKGSLTSAPEQSAPVVVATGQATVPAAPPVNASDTTPQTCKGKFTSASLSLLSDGAALAFDAQDGTYHIAAFTPPGTGVGREVGSEVGTLSPLRFRYKGLECGKTVPVQIDYGCGTVPLNAGYNGGSFGGWLGYAVMVEGPKCPLPEPTPRPTPTPTPSPSPTPTPDPSPTPKPSPSPSPSPSPTPPPAPGACYYRVSCGGLEDGGPCNDHAQQTICEATLGGSPLVGGIWRNFGEQALRNHCQYTVPGLSNLNFQLNPGKSAPSCLNKRD